MSPDNLIFFDLPSVLGRPVVIISLWFMCVCVWYACSGLLVHDIFFVIYMYKIR